jgi:rhamnosyltransferase
MKQRAIHFVLVIPTCNASSHWDELSGGILAQSRTPDQVLIIDSSSSDNTVERARAAGFDVVRIGREAFNHGGTRQLAAELTGPAAILTYLTQDAIPCGPDAFKNLLEVFTDPGIGASYGRQLPRPEADPLEAHARLFNYPIHSRVRSLACRQELGFKSIFLSNSFAAYRREALMGVGGFPLDVIFGEDTVVAARLHCAGWKTAYVAEACVSHSHTYTIAEEFQRYFDIGVLHAREHWLIDQFGKTGGEGMRFVLSELRYLLRHGVRLIPTSLLRNLTKLIAYRAGLHEQQIGVEFKRRLGRNKTYWVRPVKSQTLLQAIPVENLQREPYTK